MRSTPAAALPRNAWRAGGAKGPALISRVEVEGDRARAEREQEQERSDREKPRHQASRSGAMLIMLMLTLVPPNLVILLCCRI